jgi:hypothetical protein
MPIDPSALLNLWSLEELPACDEGMEHARAFLTSAGEAVSSIENHDPRLLLLESVVLFRIFAAHSATCPKCNQQKRHGRGAAPIAGARETTRRCTHRASLESLAVVLKELLAPPVVVMLFC